MKKILLTGLIFSVCFFMNGTNALCIDNDENNMEENITDITRSRVSIYDIKEAIRAYKTGDYLTCISILKEYTQKDENNAVAWYYLGSAYMNLAMVDEANKAFDRVIMLDAAPKLVSYAIQAQLCMQRSGECKYEKFTPAEIRKLKENPVGFLEEYYGSLQAENVKPDDIIQIENLINGNYANNIHPQANDFILNEKAKIQASQINSDL